MPPKTRSGHVEKLEAQQLLKSGRANVAGLPAIPPEILVNIISHFTCIPVPFNGSFRRHFSFQFLERFEALQTLSQTCRRLRSVILPIMWEKIEVGVRRHQGKDRGYPKRLATELVRQLEIVTVRDPTLAPYVREISVCLSHYSQATVFPELVRALHMFPNVHALQIFAPSYHIREEITKAFHGHTFPSVELLTMKQPIYALAKSFPQVKSYYTSDCMAACYHWDTIIKHWKMVTEIRGLAVPGRGTLASVATELPHLTYLEIEAEGILIPNGFLNLIALLRPLKNLQDIKLIVNKYATNEQYVIAKANIASALAKLQSFPSQKHREKSIIIELRKGAGDTPQPFAKQFESS